MAKYCPIIDHKVTFLFCEDCDGKLCRNSTSVTKNKESKKIKEGNKKQ